VSAEPTSFSPAPRCGPLRKWTRGVGLAALLGLLGGCAGTGLSEHPVAVTQSPRAPEISPQAEREHARILAAYGGEYINTRLAGLLQQTTEKLVAASERPDVSYRITILNSPAVNAFALPSGNLYVTRGLLALANDTSELASVLSHEMAHVVARHASMREDQARQAAIVTRVVTDVLNDPQLGALALAKSKIALASFSRAQELEADSIGVGMSARAGYDPYGATRFLTAMGRNAGLRTSRASDGEQKFVDFLSSHPSTPDRVKNAQATARQHSAPGAGMRDKAAYLAAAEGLSFGEDPSEGYVRGRRFVHPKLGFTFTAPDGFTLDNTAQAVLGLKQGNGQALRVDVVRVAPEQGLPAYLTSGWIEGVDPRSVEELSINGFSGATAVAKGQQWTFRLYIIRFGSEVYRFVFAAKSRTPEADHDFRESVQTFRRMSTAEIERTRPLRIKIVTVHNGDTADRMAARMATDRPLERFLVLNGFAPGQALTPGDLVKIVAE
jgi:predicted Zn-dependent protease